ncbi:hypothetical protein MPLB_1700153 [Mesorhizobium sp. ORS 3324]|nr:hypothetical protein MPLB_1700153 [Mesorhizobium sp. ORS 3324]
MTFAEATPAYRFGITQSRLSAVRGC